MKKVIRYMQNQAVQYSDEKYNSAAYLSPRQNKEPQQRRHRSQGYKSHHITHAESRSSNPSAHAHSFPHHVSGAGGPARVPHAIQKVQYGTDNILQSYELFIPDSTPDPIKSQTHHHHETNSPSGSGYATPTPKYWVLYIHGGYFRDPKVSASSFHATLHQLTNPTNSDETIRDIQPHIAGYASINYRLAPHEGHPDDEDHDEHNKSGDIPDYEKRNAQWPDMINDVLAAIKHLQSKHHFGERYLLVGHSVGATMALLTILKSGEAGIEPPAAVAGVCGIYDFETLHEKWKGYDMMTKNAIRDEKEWGRASPGKYKREQYEEAWGKEGGKKRRGVILAQSKGDELVDFGQAEEMMRVLEGDQPKKGDGDGDEGDRMILVDLMEIKGRHNEVWEKGGELARVVAAGVGEMMSLDQ